MAAHRVTARALELGARRGGVKVLELPPGAASRRASNCRDHVALAEREETRRTGIRTSDGQRDLRAEEPDQPTAAKAPVARSAHAAAFDPTTIRYPTASSM